MATRRPRSLPLPELGPGVAVVVLGLLSATTWGAGDFGGGLLSRRVPLLALVGLSQLTGVFGALVIAILHQEPLPTWPDLGWAGGAGFAGVIGITSLYRGLAVGRMGVVAPVTGVLAAVMPVTVGFASQGVPRLPTVIGIVAALLAVVLVTRAPGHGADRPSGIRWALLAGLGIGSFNICIGQFAGSSPFGLLVVIRILQALTLAVLIILARQPWRLGRDVVPRILVIGVLDMAGNAAFILAAQVGPLAVAAMLSSLYPVTTVILAILVLRERMTRSHLAGIALTAIAVGLISAGAAAN